MRTLLLTVLLVLAAVTAPAAAPAAAAPAAAAEEQDPLDQLKAVPGLTVVSETQPAGYRFFVLSYTQPVDHRDPRKGTFQQRLTLLHRAVDVPVVLYTGGYGLAVNPAPSRTEPTRILDANQVSVEHRFFRSSRPAPADWSDLDIWQEATDEHRIVQMLRTIYPGRWIQTGASKGGMTSVYHRRFYPGDVDGVVAYVAPNDPVNPLDRDYDRFFAQVGTPSCRQALDAAQREALLRRDRMVPLLEADAARNGYTFTRTLGSADRSYEMTVLDTVWAFWQYSTAADCASVPPVTATDEQLYAWIDAVAFFGFYTDQGLEYYWPYYYQAATQLGWPDLTFAHLRGLTRHRGLYQPNSVLPAELRSRHQPWPMLDVDHWVRARSERMMFVYGQNDPWSAERFTPSGRDSYLYVVPGANHGANIASLPEAEQTAAIATLRRWAGATSALRSPGTATLPDDDMLVHRRPA
ncbi:Prolyl tri/tetrapeptidyl aminopeptidase precursor [Nonomuraea coxensis DSM 45129]|uniref:Prolyl tri/tetrapeptidyl aminopeptidase n=1 Tax=Nonomuraea coxensis DSM 45129 TaxID=1122611 RepID=A0ABX8U3X0_9ACTN|nr:S28 family serine protease [Nonomuraea coxensis]QYC42437.1 Prolyl tri/tetrapeptidyl aminopeptidase precursor [Nonomuraea coxensis DSM 45129]